MRITRNTYSEVYSFLETLGYDFIRKLPKNEYNKIIEQRNKEYYCKYSIKDFYKKLSIEAQSLIISFHLKYWCDTKEEKRDIITILNINEEKLKKKYEVFKDNAGKKNNIENTNNMQLIKIQEDSILNKIKKYLKRVFRNRS